MRLVLFSWLSIEFVWMWWSLFWDHQICWLNFIGGIASIQYLHRVYDKLSGSKLNVIPNKQLLEYWESSNIIWFSIRSIWVVFKYIASLTFFIEFTRPTLFWKPNLLRLWKNLSSWENLDIWRTSSSTSSTCPTLHSLLPSSETAGCPPGCPAGRIDTTAIGKWTLRYTNFN